ncbi:hypothetical protein H6G45_08635 [Synechocystis sp. FACHB-383]|uniref:STM4504/CBY_0614 family protein n=1 Tax=Synechocystis sp. FACHB-383 TaxID=2692864 RepID=UPI0016834A1C|nr:hypothetical protein [Synechocystis sp. FACHB-383]MBD2653556.1 hypothetical protein [Synechocystis sp. FACHB-383]
MALFDLFSKRQKRLRGEVPEVYVYDNVPKPLRVQLIQILSDGIGDERYHRVSLSIYSEIHKILCREYGVFSLTNNRYLSDWESIANYLLETEDIEQIIDIFELGLRSVDTIVRREGWQHIGCATSPDDTIFEVNTRFKEHGIGFEYVSGEIIRIDSQLIHNDVVKPALKLLSNPRFKGANDEFLKAHEHYRHGRYKECLKAFESTMKTICDLKGWKYQTNDTAKKLIDVCIANELFPTFMECHVKNLRVILESGVPTVRNKLGGHGQGSTITTVSESTARFALHCTAANILLFVE